MMKRSHQWSLALIVAAAMGGCGDASVYGTASGGGDAAQASGGSVSSAAVGVGGGTPSATSAGGSGGMARRVRPSRHVSRALGSERGRSKR